MSSIRKPLLNLKYGFFPSALGRRKSSCGSRSETYRQDPLSRRPWDDAKAPVAHSSFGQLIFYLFFINSTLDYKEGNRAPKPLFLRTFGEVAEWLNAAVSKTVVPCSRYRGFESPSLRIVKKERT